MTKETSFVLKMIEEVGMSPAEATLVMKHFGDDSRIDCRSAVFQIALLKLVAKSLINEAEAKEAKEAGKGVQKVEVVNAKEAK